MLPADLRPSAEAGDSLVPAVPRRLAGARAALRWWGRRRADLYWAAGVCAVLIGVDVLLRAYLGRPFWYDEIWRGHFVSEPLGTFWPELARANTPSAVGWVIVERLCGDVLGWHTWALRLPGFLALPLLGAGIVLLIAPFAGRLAATFAALWICLNSTLLDLGTQLKPYSFEALVAVVAVLLWLHGERRVDGGVRQDAQAAPAGEASSSGEASLRASERRADSERRVDRRRLTCRTLAGVVSLFSVPAIFVIGPLAAADVLLAAAYAWRAADGPFRGTRRPTGSPLPAGRRRATQVLAPAASRALEALPALLLTAANTFLFVAHQSSQRLGHYWDAQFLAGRGAGGGIAFIGRELSDLVTGSPPGIDRYDPSLLHAPTDGTWAAAWLLGPAVVGCGLVGIAALARRHDGRLVLVALGGAQLAMLAASAVRFWPFGPTRTNLFVVPLIVLVVVTGAAVIVRAAARHARAVLSAGTATSAVGARVATTTVAIILIATVGAAGVGAGWASAAKDGKLYAQRDRLRGLDLTVDATLAARRLYQPGDVVLVGGRLMRPGWIYAMEASDDGARRPAALPPLPAGATSEPARIPRADTVFFSVLGEGQVAAAVAARPAPPRRLLLFVFDGDTAATRPDVADLRRAGWCSTASYAFAQTGALTVLTRC